MTDEHLVKCALLTLATRKSISSRGVPLWSAVRDLFQIGSTSSVMLCERFGVDPHQLAAPLAFEDDGRDTFDPGPSCAVVARCVESRAVVRCAPGVANPCFDALLQSDHGDSVRLSGPAFAAVRTNGVYRVAVVEEPVR